MPAPRHTSPAGSLLHPLALARYDGLTLLLRRGMGARAGDRRFPGRPQASGIEVESFKTYAPGDDLRHLDWNAAARLDTLLVRRFTAEREMVVHVLLDSSASMAVPARDDKLGTARELAMALAYLVLAANDALRVGFLAGDAPPRPAPLLRQRGSIARVAELLTSVQAAGALDLAAALAAYARRHPAPGAALVISDFMMEPAEVERGVEALCARGDEVHLLHVIAASELDPRRDFTRGLLADAESGATRSVVLTPATLERYRAALASHLAALHALAERWQARYARIATDDHVPTFVTTELQRAGLVGRR